MMDAVEKAGRAFCDVVVGAIHDKVRSRGGSASLSGSEYYMYPPAIEAFDKAIEAAIIAERKRCADTARRYLEDIAGCDMNDDEPDKIAAAVLGPDWRPSPP